MRRPVGACWDCYRGQDAERAEPDAARLEALFTAERDEEWDAVPRDGGDQGEGMIVDIFAARVLGKTEESVPRLLLGPATLLGTSNSPVLPPGSGFQPADEDDLGAEFDDDSDDESGAADAV